MRHTYHGPTCSGSMRRTGQNVRALDFFCAACRLAVSVVDENWAQVMRPSDLARQTVPLARVRVLVRGTGSLENPNGSGPLAC
jgi:hypothetical protein